MLNLREIFSAVNGRWLVGGGWGVEGGGLVVEGGGLGGDGVPVVGGEVVAIFY